MRDCAIMNISARMVVWLCVGVHGCGQIVLLHFGCALDQDKGKRKNNNFIKFIELLVERGSREEVAVLRGVEQYVARGC